MFKSPVSLILSLFPSGPVYRDVMTPQWGAVLTHAVVLHPGSFTPEGQAVQVFWQAPRKVQASDLIIPPPAWR